MLLVGCFQRRGPHRWITAEPPDRSLGFDLSSGLGGQSQADPDAVVGDVQVHRVRLAFAGRRHGSLVRPVDGGRMRAEEVVALVDGTAFEGAEGHVATDLDAAAPNTELGRREYLLAVDRDAIA